MAGSAGGRSSTITVQCGGQPNVQAVLAAGQLQTIATGWTCTCDTVILGSSNGWDTNFESLVLG